jgi:hypothetical protein
MKFGIRLAVAAVATAALAGCGGAKLGKGEAAAIVFGASDPAKKANQGGGALSLFQNGQGLGTATVSCSEGGTATLSVSATGITGEDSANWAGAYDIEYDGCAEPRQDDPNTPEVENGTVILDGKLTMGMDFDLDLTAGTFEMEFRMQGRIEIGGDYSDFIDADITQTVSATASADGSESSVVVNGTIETSTETYTYDNETYSFVSSVNDNG